MVTLDYAQASGENAYSYLFGSLLNGQVSSGLMDRASGGVLYIPKLDKLPANALELLGAAVESNGYTPEGGRDFKPLACRIICSAGENLEQLVQDKRLPGPLYFHLNVLPLKVPALRNRPEDIPELIRYFSEWFPNQENLPYRSFSVSVQNRMRNHSWPGNVRELRNVIQRLLVLGGKGEVTTQEVDDALSQSTASMDPAESGHEGLFDLPLREAREQFERDYLTYQLKKAGGSVGIC